MDRKRIEEVSFIPLALMALIVGSTVAAGLIFLVYSFLSE